MPELPRQHPELGLANFMVRSVFTNNWARVVSCSAMPYLPYPALSSLPSPLSFPLLSFPLSSPLLCFPLSSLLSSLLCFPLSDWIIIVNWQLSPCLPGHQWLSEDWMGGGTLSTWQSVVDWVQRGAVCAKGQSSIYYSLLIAETVFKLLTVKCKAQNGLTVYSKNCTGNASCSEYIYLRDSATPPAPAPQGGRGVAIPELTAS